MSDVPPGSLDSKRFLRGPPYPPTRPKVARFFRFFQPRTANVGILDDFGPAGNASKIINVSAVEVIAFAKPGVTVRPVSNSYDPRHSGLLTYFVLFAGPVKGAHASAWRPDYDQGV